MIEADKDIKAAAPSIFVRPAAEQDCQRLCDIYLAVRRQTFTWVSPDHFRRDDFLMHSKGEEQLICEVDASVVGFISVFRPENFIHMLFVMPAFQGYGVGGALLAALPGWPQQSYRLKCLVKNQRARGFYLSKGFKVTGSGASTEGDYEELTFAGQP